MAVISVQQAYTGRRGNLSDKGEAEYSVGYIVLTDSATDDQLTVLTAPGLPRFGDVYSYGGNVDLGAFVKSVEPTQSAESRYKWEVTVTYSTTAIDTNNPTIPDSQPNPLLRSAEIVWDVATVEMPIVEDRDGAAIVSSSYEAFDPAPTILKPQAKLTINKNLVDFDPQVAFDYTGAINSDVFFGGAAETWLCTGIRGTKIFENGVYYWAVSYDFAYDPDNWRLKVLDQGFYPFQSANDVFSARRAVKNGSETSTPVFLDPDGTESETAKIVEFDVYRLQSFAALNLP